MRKSLLILLTLYLAITSNAQTTVNLNANQNTYIETFGGGMGKNAFLQFDISSIPGNAVITDVRFNGYVFYQQAAWDGDVRYIRFNDQTWIETDSSQLIWNTLFFTDTVIQLGGFGMINGYSQSPDLTQLFVADFEPSNTYFTIVMKDVDDVTCCPAMVPSLTNTDSLLVGNIFNDKMAFRPRLYVNPNQRPYLAVTYGIPPSALISNPGANVCEGNVVTFDASLSTGDGPLNYQWQYNGVDILGETGNTYTINPIALTDAGNYSVVVTNVFGSDTSLQTSISVTSIPTPDLGIDTTTCYGQPMQLDAGAGYDSYSWSIGSSINQFLVVDTSITSIDTNDVVVTVSVNGCVGYDTVQVILDPCGSGIEDAEINNFTIYPNPNHGSFNVVIEYLDKESTFDVVNSLGEVIYTQKVGAILNKQNIPVNISALPNGIYFVRLYNGEFNHIEKTIKN